MGKGDIQDRSGEVASGDAGWPGVAQGAELSVEFQDELG
jgi:hypothetical protein